MEQGRDGVNGIAAEEFADRRGACAERARASGLDALVVTAPSDLRYLVGYPGVAALGPNPFCAGPAAAVVLRPSGEATLCAGEPDLSFAGAPVDAVGPLQVEAYKTFASMEPLEPRVRARAVRWRERLEGRERSGSSRPACRSTSRRSSPMLCPAPTGSRRASSS